jgi:TRAP-type mannitol/chloroaromatic compound transport system permease small subunit
LGEIVKYLVVFLVFQMSFEVMMRYLFNRPTVWGYDTAVMTGTVIYAIAWAYADLFDQHVRVDILYSRWTGPRKAIIDILGGIFFFIPFIATMLYASFYFMWLSWAEHEIRAWTFWYPPAAPIRTVFFLGVVLFLLRGIMRLTRDIYFVARGKHL